MKLFAKHESKKQHLLEWQKLVLENPPKKLIVKEEELRRITIEQVQNHLKVIGDSAELLKSTVNPDVFFSRYDLLLERVAIFSALSKYVEVNTAGQNIAESHDKLLAERDKHTRNFIYRYINDRTSKAAAMKTERGKIGRYQRAYDDMREYYPRMSADNVELAEKAFPYVTKDEGNSSWRLEITPLQPSTRMRPTFPTPAGVISMLRATDIGHAK